MTIWLGGSQGSRTQLEEIVLRFKTARATGLLLVTTSADSNYPDRLEISLVTGRVRASVRLGDREKVIKYCSLPYFYAFQTSLRYHFFSKFSIITILQNNTNFIDPIFVYIDRSKWLWRVKRQ